MRRRHAIAALLAPLTLLLGGCKEFDTRPDPPAADIREVRVEPHPVPTGGTATLTVLHSHAGEPGFSYYWSVPRGAETESPRYVWTAQVPPGEYSFSVQVRRMGNYIPAQKAFTVTVVASL